MKAYEYILTKQIQWALNRNLALIGSKGNRGRPSYIEELEDNLFQPLLLKTRREFKFGDGREILDISSGLAKMKAVHSSSALSVNVFQYWQKINQVSSIASACGLCNKNSKYPEDISFEQKYPINESFQFHPNIDVIIKNKKGTRYKIYAIECKFSEAYSTQGHSGIKQKYIDFNDIWRDIPNLYELAKSISPEDNVYDHLHPAQLIKHILGLKKKYGKRGFRLLYLWYDTLGYEGFNHRKEIERFQKLSETDNICFHAMSYQELIIRLSSEYRDNHEDYIEYITSRYL